MIPLVITTTSFLFAVGLGLGVILYLIIRRALAVVGAGILGITVGSFLQPLPNPVGVLGYYIGSISLGVAAVGFLIILLKLALELVKNEEFAPYRL